MTYVKKRSIVVGGHKTSVSLEEPFWAAVKEIAALQNTTPSKLIEQVEGTRASGNLASAIRLCVLNHYKSLAAN